jgi:hypothetical protein
MVIVSIAVVIVTTRDLLRILSRRVRRPVGGHARPHRWTGNGSEHDASQGHQIQFLHTHAPLFSNTTTSLLLNASERVSLDSCACGQRTV